MLPGRRSAQRPVRAAVAVQRAVGRAVAGEGPLCEEIGVTDVDTGTRTVLSMDEAGREIWVDEKGAVTEARPYGSERE